ncbi:MAG: translation initiation factor IF-1 [Candidatus Nealsonbacteria bacterium]|nr:translation initiation factor IF-1 [Candidatus Nealsonbacteria bacterium]
MVNQKTIRKSGVVVEALPSTTFRVKLDDGSGEALCHLAGRLRMFRIKILPGDRVTVEMTPYDEKRGRIVYRGK